ncbi:MAG: helix-hairpin-helix domain-containing protein [Bacteroidota bacterium]
MGTPARGWVLRGGVALAILAPCAMAQVPTDSTGVPSDTVVVSGGETGRLEALLEDDLTGDPTELIELLDELAENPLDVNTATAAELALIPALDPLTASAVIRFREANGLFRSLPEVQLVEGLTPEIYLDARPYLTIGPRLETTSAQAQRFPAAPALRTVLRGLSYRTTQRVQRRLDTQAGYEGPDSTRAFAGSPERIYTRLQATYRRQVSLNLTLEKDPGEAFRFDSDSNTYGYDYLSGHAALLDAGRIDALILGDFAAEYGQGVALWRASGFGKGPDAVGGPIRTGRGLRPYGSVEENRFFRGAALSVAATPNVFVSGFASRRQLDANVFVPDTLDLADPDIPPTALDGATVTSFGADGLHRTDTELSRKDALGQTLVGGGAEFRLATGTVEGRAGVVGYTASFDAPIGQGTRPDQRFNFSGDRATVVSAYADVKTRAGQAFGEAVRGAGGRFGGLAGVQADLGSSADLLLIGRHYEAGFTSLHGYPFGERNGVGQNETGLYAGVRVRPSRTWTVNAYFDQYRFPYLRFGVPRPSQGHEALINIEHRPRRWIRVYMQARTETKETGIDVPNIVSGSTVRGLANETRQTLRLHGEWSANRVLRLRARVEGSRFVETDGTVDTGALVYQDVRWQPTHWLQLDTRLTLFRTDDFDARLYAFENDLTGVFAIPALSGQGARGYVLLSATPIDNLSLQAKLASTWLRGVRRIGSGNSQVQGDRVRDLGVQVRYRF